MMFRVTLAIMHIVLTKEEAVSLCLLEIVTHHTLSGRIGKVVASHVAVACSIPLRCTD